MTIETAPQTSQAADQEKNAAKPPASDGACPPWCTGRHGQQDGVTETEVPWYWHLSAGCPPWCTGHPAHVRDISDEAHVSTRNDIELSLAEPYEIWGGNKVADYFETSVWQLPDASAPDVTIFHAAKEDYLPGMTPAEAMALAANLVRAAGVAAPTQVPGSTGTSCPPWCICRPHGPLDDVHISESRSVSVIEDTICGHTRDYQRGLTARACDHGNRSSLAIGDDGNPLVSLSHGDDSLPYMTLAAAETFALNILELISIARTPSPEG